METLQEVYSKIINKYNLYGEKGDLFGFLINNFPKDSPVIKENLKEDSPVLLAFEEFKSLIG